jgi:hypothetical protein
MSIYVSIASYEDPGLLKTIQNCLNNAKYPDEIVFGLALMYKTLPDLSEIKNKKIIHEYNSDERPGLVNIRNKLKEDFSDEDYFLQIDSHTNFINNWDVELINDLKNIQSKFGKNSLISKRVNANVGILHNVDPDFMSHNGLWSYNKKLKNIIHSIEYLDIDYNGYDEEYTKTMYASCHFLFGDKHFIKNVRFDDVSEFIHEEVFLSFLIYIQGFDIYKNNYINHIGHNPFDYNMFLYNKKQSQDISKPFVSNKYRDPIERLEACNDFIICGNNETYKDFNFVRSAGEFWQAVGLEHILLNVDN